MTSGSVGSHMLALSAETTRTGAGAAVMPELVYWINRTLVTPYAEEGGTTSLSATLSSSRWSRASRVSRNERCIGCSILQGVSISGLAPGIKPATCLQEAWPHYQHLRGRRASVTRGVL